jgi:hypothetical protein
MAKQQAAAQKPHPPVLAELFLCEDAILGEVVQRINATPVRGKQRGGGFCPP